MERSVFNPDEPHGIMSLENLRNTLRGLFQGDLMGLRPRASMILDDMEYSTDPIAAAAWAGTGVTVTKTTTKQVGNFALQLLIDATDHRGASVLKALNLSAFIYIKLWERVDVASSAIRFFVEDSEGNQSYWNITTNGTQDTWQQDTLTLASPDGNNGTPAVLSDIVKSGFQNLEASQTYIIDDIKAVSGLNVGVDQALVANFYQQVYCGQTQITFAGGASPAITPPVANPRIDLLTLDSAGTLAWTVGTEATTPTEPAFPTGKIPICLVYCKITMVKVVDFEDKDANPNEAYIYKDVRPLFVWMAID